ncbi:MAG: enoyl-CoA hydratase/isomerase family protein [Acidimicrobiaceae bacterium]|nr:enoyl-CoA hydratase/isomerase family protein [Acidimicrobiaceae bacterium]
MTDSVAIEIGDDYVATIELRRPPNNFFSLEMITAIAEGLESLDDDPRCRAAVMCAQGKHFCAGADFSPEGARYTTEDLYAAAVRIFRTHTPVVAAVQGAAVGGGLGLALAADFRIAAPEARFSANFARLGFHQGFGVSVTLPRVVGPQVAADLLFTGRRVPGEEAAQLGLADGLAHRDDLRTAAWGTAREIAMSAPLAVRSIRATLRGDLADQVEAAAAHEHREQSRLQHTADFAEGSRAMLERRTPEFRGE